MIQNVEQHIAIEGVCAWPNLTLLPDGTITTAIFNQPCHGAWEGDVDCWASTDGGVTWQFRGRPAPHEPGTNRMNCAAGLAGNGDLLVLVSGWSHRSPVGIPSPHGGPSRALPAWICRSADGGHTWRVIGELPADSNDPDPGEPDSGGKHAFIPFGDIVAGADEALCVTVYREHDDGPDTVHFLRSDNDGATWQEVSVLNPAGNETALLHLGNGRWLAASRLVHLDLLTSHDDGQNWAMVMPVTLPRQIPGHLLRLHDGSIVLTYGNRCLNNFGIDARLSSDEGQTWGAPFRLADMPLGDGGYPASVQRADGKIVTAYYTQQAGDHQYQMAVAIWNPTDFRP